MPDYSITRTSQTPPKWRVAIEEGVADEVELFFRIDDGNQDTDTVAFTSAGPL